MTLVSYFRFRLARIGKKSIVFTEIAVFSQFSSAIFVVSSLRSSSGTGDGSLDCLDGPFKITSKANCTVRANGARMYHSWARSPGTLNLARYSPDDWSSGAGVALKGSPAKLIIRTCKFMRHSKLLNQVDA